MLSQYWGYLHQKELPSWLRSPLLGLYVKAFGCNMAEAQVEQLTKYRNLCELFTRKLKPGAREICQSVELVSYYKREVKTVHDSVILQLAT